MNYGNSQSQPQSQNTMPSQGFELLRKYSMSPLFLSAAVVYSLMILIQLINIFIPRWNYIESYLNFIFNNAGINEVGGLSDYFNNFSSFMDSAKIFYGAAVAMGVIALIGPALIGVGLWMQYSAAKDTSTAQIKTTGFSIIKVITIINFVITAAVMAFIAIIFLIMGIAGAVAAASRETAAAVALIIVFGIFFLIFAGVTAFMVVYYLKIISTIKSLTVTASTGKIDDKQIPVFVPIVNIIFAASQLFSILYMIIILPIYSLMLNNISRAYSADTDISYFYQNFSNILPAKDIILSSITSLLSGAFLALISILLLSYRKKITSMLYYNNNNNNPPLNVSQNYNQIQAQTQNPVNIQSFVPPDSEQNKQEEERRQEPFVPPS